MFLTAKDQELYRKYSEKLINYEDALRQADYKNIMRLAIKLNINPRRRNDGGGSAITSPNPIKPKPTLDSHTQLDTDSNHIDSENT